MKISKLFHWLYFTVMMFPIFILPIFAIAVRSDNNFQPIELQVQNSKVVDFNQLFINGDFSDNSGYWSPLNSSLDFSDGNAIVVQNSTNVSSDFGLQYSTFSFYSNHKYLVKLDIKVSSDTTFRCRYPFISSYIPVYNTFNTFSFIFDDFNNDRFYFQVQHLDNTITATFDNIMCFDLTQMFGYGSEPTVEQFNTLYSNDYYDYTISHKELLNNYSTSTYNYTDVGSQMVYTMYQGVDKYFNFDVVFNFGDLYNWLQLTFFNGTAPLGFFIFWHLLIYWLLISLLWLLFDVLIYVPMLIHRWLDKASLS